MSSALDPSPARCSILALIGLLIFVAGCAGAKSVVVPIDATQAAPRGTGVQRLAEVKVTDVRREANLERTSLGLSMGLIELKPPAPELVKLVVETKADEVLARLGLAEPYTVQCGIRAFDITTPSNPLYWDVNAKIELVLRAHGEDRTVSATATERTFIWPSGKLIARVVTEALRRVAADSERALGEFFAPTP